MMWKLNYLTAIVFLPPDPSTRLYFPVKYRNISKAKRDKFENYLKERFPTAKYVNYYERSDKTFVERVYL